MSFLYLTKESKHIMTFIDRKTNGQFPGRKKRETNGIRPMRTDMSVVSQSDMYEGANMSNKGLRMSNSLVRISIVFFFLIYLAFLLIDIDFDLFWLKVKWTIFSKSLRLLFSRLGWRCRGAALFLLVINFFLWIEKVIDGDLTLYVRSDGASSSQRPTLDLNFPPAEEPEPEPEPDSTQPPQEEVELRRHMEEHIFRRLRDKSPLGTNPEQLFKQARETAQLKRQMIDRMLELDSDHSDFWRTHRYKLITDCLLTNRQTDYAPHHLQEMLRELSQPNSKTLRKILNIRSNYLSRGTFF